MLSESAGLSLLCRPVGGRCAWNARRIASTPACTLQRPYGVNHAACMQAAAAAPGAAQVPAGSSTPSAATLAIIVAASVAGLLLLLGLAALGRSTWLTKRARKWERMNDESGGRSPAPAAAGAPPAAAAPAGAGSESLYAARTEYTVSCRAERVAFALCVVPAGMPLCMPLLLT